MKSAATLAIGLTAFANCALGHYIFERFTYGGEEYPVYQYIRPNTNYNSPVTDLTSDDLRCNQGGETGTTTQTITVQAGAAFTFTTDVAVYHDGPLSIYMAKAPTTAAAFDGSGQVWFKILDIGPTFSGGTSTWDLEQSYSYTIPKALPNGDYLLRIQQLAIHNPWPAGIPQFYTECAQITVTGGGSGTPGPLVSIPGFIDGTEPGYTVNIYTNFFNYTVPGPAVWAGQNGAGGASPVPTTPAPTTASATKATSTTVSTPTKVSTTPVAIPTVVAPGTVAEYGQCGGIGWTGGTGCVSPFTCQVLNAYYSQCLS